MSRSLILAVAAGLGSAAVIATAGLGGCAAVVASLPQIVSLGITLAQAANGLNTTPNALVQAGATLCGDVASPSGHIVGPTVVAVANMAGTPTLVTNAATADVAAACPSGLVPGGLPVGVNPATIPVIATQAASKLPTAAASPAS